MESGGKVQWDALWIDARLATMAGPNYGAIEDGALAVADGRIAWVGRRADLPLHVVRATHDAKRQWITPALIDCHTHIVHGGDRAGEFELRLKGASYEEIARAGGGIRSTVAATRAAGLEELIAGAARRLTPLMAEGVTTIEIKSGYGLDRANEIKMLRAARRLGERWPVTVKTSYLGAHALPVEFADRSDAYIDFLCAEALPAAAAEGLVDAVDAFCDTIGFTPAQTTRMFEAARKLNLPVKLHAEQLSDQDGAALAARYGALSADHLEHVSEPGVAAMAKSGTVAVLLPGAFYFLRETKLPPIDLFRRHGVPMAISTDSNPGSSPATSLLLMLNMASTFFRMTPEEALAGVTRHAARAVGLQASHGTLEVGKVADFVLWDIAQPAELAYRIGFNPCAGVVKNGQVVNPAALAL
ncbi:MAG: imidazolonepropionase [Alphaproteobacteria bacterium]|nr:imidazolonepropionase [Alphaproteobacteria bacterium]